MFIATISIYAMKKQRLTTYFATLIILGLFCSFGLHAVQVEHTHAHGGDVHTESTEIPVLSLLGEYMHQSDKKYVIAVVILFVSPFIISQLLSLLLGVRNFAYREFEKSKPYRIHTARLFDITHHLLGDGLMHTKVY
jgi:hypothetical protein